MNIEDIELDNDLPQVSLMLADGREIVMAIHEDNGPEVRFYEMGYEIDSANYVAFEELESGNYLIVHMFPPFVKQGLGESALRFFKDVYNTKLIIEPFGGPERENGSRILPDAVGFFQKMIDRYVVENNSDLSIDDDDYFNYLD